MFIFWKVNFQPCFTHTHLGTARNQKFIYRSTSNFYVCWSVLICLLIRDLIRYVAKWFLCKCVKYELLLNHFLTERMFSFCVSVVLTSIMLFDCEPLYVVQISGMNQCSSTDCSLVHWCPTVDLLHAVPSLCNNCPMIFPVRVRWSLPAFLFHYSSTAYQNMLDSELCDQMIFMIDFCVVLLVDAEMRQKLKKIHIFITRITE